MGTRGTIVPIVQFSTLPQSVLNDLWPRENVSVCGPCSHTASSLHDISLI